MIFVHDQFMMMLGVHRQQHVSRPQPILPTSTDSTFRLLRHVIDNKLQQRQNRHRTYLFGFNPFLLDQNPDD